MSKHPAQEEFYIYNMILSNPSPEIIGMLPELGVQVRKIIDGIWYLSASFITHRQAKFICEKTGVVATKFRRIQMNLEE